MIEFKIDRNPYADDAPLYKRSKLLINSGLTVLVGCNGSGKSTLLGLLKDLVEKRKGACVLDYDDKKDGGSMRISELIFSGATSYAASMIMSSEGERIHQSVGLLYSKLGSVMRSSKKPKEVWVLMDAVSSGLSIDNVQEIKDFIVFVQEQEPNVDFYFIVSTNEYEFADSADCVSMVDFSHKTFKSYSSYKKFILKTRECKDRRYKTEDD